jgi:RND family efflux transporter MFP subunit
MRIPPLVIGAVLVAGAFGLWRWQHPADAGDGAPAAAASEPARAASMPMQVVGVIAAVKQDVPVRFEASGTVTALASVDLRAQTTSTVAQVLVKDGQAVRKGDLLFRFDDRADRASLDKAKAQLVRDRATIADLDRQVRRAQDLVAQKFVSQSALDTALSNLEAAQAGLKSDEAALQSAQVALSYNELRAPISGRIGTVNVFPGSLVQANASATPLLNIAQLDPISIAFNVPETQLSALLEATRGGTLEAEALVPSGARGGAPVKGKVNFVDNLVDSATGTIKAKAVFDNKTEALWPGQYLRVRVTLRTLKDAVVVPVAAVILRGTERSVYVVGPDQTAKQLPVKVALQFGEQAVVEGVQAGMQVVVDGKQNLRPGTPLKTQPTQLVPAAKAASAAASGASR